MGQQQSKRSDGRGAPGHEIPTDEEIVTSDDEMVHSDEEMVTDEEHGGTEIEIITISGLSKDDTSHNSELKEKGPLSLKRFLIILIVTLIAAIVAGITFPLVFAKKEKAADSGDILDYGGLPAKPTDTEEVGEPSSSADISLETTESSSQEDGLIDTTGKNENRTAYTPEDDELNVSEEEEAPKFLPRLPFEDVNLPSFTAETLRGYNNRREFEEALVESTKFLINKIVLQNLGFTSPFIHTGNHINGFGTWRGSDQEEEAQGFHDVTDYETNNQKIGVDEADRMKADSNYVYAAYSNYVLVWDKNGNQVAQAKMPSSAESDENTPQGPYGIFSGYNFGTFSGHKAHVESLLLVDGYLVVIVSGYGNSEESGEKRALMNYKGTHIRTYKTTNVATNGKLDLVGTKDINGRFVDARSVGNQVHITTTSAVDTQTHLIAPFNRFVNFPGLSNDEYVDRVRALALEKYIPNFVGKVSNELLYHDQNKVLPNLLQLSLWQSSDGRATSEGQAMVDANMFRSGLINSVTLITSFDVAAAPMVDPAHLSHELVTTTSGFLAPSQQTHLYGTESKLVLAARAWNWNSEIKAAEEVTHLVVLEMNEGDANSETVTTSFHSLGTVPGYILNPYSLDIKGDELRVATTVSRRWRFQGIPLLSSNTVDVGDHNSNKVNVIDRSADQEDKSVIEDSITENYIYVLDLKSTDQLEERGSVQLGEKDEIITAVRFFQDIAYCVTFVQTDPFYVVDLKQIEILGSFKLNGFSNYLHPLNEEHTLILGIGQNATKDGIPTGFMITVFNTSDPTNPKAIESYTVDDTPQGGSASITSTAQWDYKSFRYVPGKLIVPLDITTHSTEGSTSDAIIQTVLGTFEGFIVFNVSPDSISEHTRISHASSACHYCGYLAPRSFVYDGNVLTAEGNIVSSTSLHSNYERWAFHVAVIGEEARCCY